MASPSETTPETASRKRRLPMLARYGLGLLISFFVLLDERDRVAIARAIRDPMSVLSERSPGQRQEGALAQSKPRLDVAAALLNAGHVIPPRSADSAPSQQLGTGGLFPKLAVADGTEPLDDPGNLHQGGGYTGPMGFPVGPAPGGGRTGDASSRQSPDVGRNPVSESASDIPPILSTSVPEPASWLTMIAGFLVLGGLLRRRKAASRVVRPGGSPLAD